MFDGKAFGEKIGGMVKDHLAAAMRPLVERLAAIEAREPLKGEKGDAGKDGADGPAPTRDQIIAAVLSDPNIIGEAVRLHLDANPPAPGRDGKDGRDGLDGSHGEKGEAGNNGAAGRDGVGLAGALIDRDGALVVTLTDGSTKHLGVIIGKDGRDGAPGRDGLGFDDMEEETADDGRTLVRRYRRGDEVREFRHALSVVIDRGVWRDAAYQKGDGVTWAGSYWIAQAETKGKPGEGGDWRLAVKRGRDGKDAPAPTGRE